MKESGCLLSIDLGTTACKVQLFSLRGEPLGGSQASYPLYSPEPSAAEQDPGEWQAAIWLALAECARNYPAHMKSVVGIGPTAQMNALVLLDREGKPLGRAQSSMDQRSTPFSARLRSELGSQPPSIYVGRNSVLGRIAWLREHRPVQFNACTRISDARGLVCAWLTGRSATDPSFGVPGWNSELEALLGISRSKLPPIHPPWHVIGRVLPGVVRQFGLTQGVPVVVGSGDGACANIAVGAIRPSQGCISLGTTGVVRCVLPEPQPLSDSIPTFSYPFIDGLWLGGAFYPAGACLAWLGRLIRSGGPADDDLDWLETLLPGAASLSPGAEGLAFTPFLFGLDCGGEQIYACFDGLRFSHQAEHFLRAILEGTSCALRSAIQALAGMDHEIKTWKATGRGTRILLWREILVQVLDRSLQLTGGDSGLGAAMLAAIGAGVYPDLPSAVAAMSQSETQLNPAPEKRPDYQKVYQRYLALAARQSVHYG